MIAEADAARLRAEYEELKRENVNLVELARAAEEACAAAGLRLCIPPLRYCGDNAAMVGALGYYEYLAGHTAGCDLNAYATMSLSTEKE